MLLACAEFACYRVSHFKPARRHPRLPERHLSRFLSPAFFRDVERKLCTLRRPGFELYQTVLISRTVLVAQQQQRIRQQVASATALVIGHAAG